MKIPSALGRKLLAFLDDEDTRHDEAYALAESLRRYNQPRRSLRPSRERREAKKADRREEMAKLRGQVFARATTPGGLTCCEACGYYRGVFELDHWQSGFGRRRAEQSVETLWVLCAHCHQQRTRNAPSAEHWNRLFAAHCAQHGYPFRPHLTRKPLESSR